MRWLFVELGVVGVTLGTELRSAGEDVDFLIFDDLLRKKAEKNGVQLQLYPAGARKHKINVIKPSARKKYDVIVISVARHRIDDALIAGVRKFVEDKTIVIPIFPAFRMPEKFELAFIKNFKVGLFPFGLGGRVLSELSFFAVLPQTSSNMQICTWYKGTKSDLKKVMKPLNDSVIRVKKTGDTSSLQKIVASFILAVSYIMRDKTVPLNPPGLSDSEVHEIDTTFLKTISRISKAGYPISRWHRLLIFMASFTRQSWIRKLLHGYFGERMQHYRSIISRQEIITLEKDLREIVDEDRNPTVH